MHPARRLGQQDRQVDHPLAPEHAGMPQSAMTLECYVSHWLPPIIVPDPLPRYLDSVVGAPEDVPVAVLIDLRPIPVHPHAGDPREISVNVSLGIAPETPGHAGPWPSQGQLSHRPAHRLPRVIDDV